MIDNIRSVNACELTHFDSYVDEDTMFRVDAAMSWTLGFSEYVTSVIQRTIDQQKFDMELKNKLKVEILDNLYTHNNTLERESSTPSQPLDPNSMICEDLIQDFSENTHTTDTSDKSIKFSGKVHINFPRTIRKKIDDFDLQEARDFLKNCETYDVGTLMSLYSVHDRKSLSYYRKFLTLKFSSQL